MADNNSRTLILYLPYSNYPQTASLSRKPVNRVLYKNVNLIYMNEAFT